MFQHINPAISALPIRISFLKILASDSVSYRFCLATFKTTIILFFIVESIHYCTLLAIFVFMENCPEIFMRKTPHSRQLHVSAHKSTC